MTVLFTVQRLLSVHIYNNTGITALYSVDTKLYTK